jgi:branched-chain amino acid transport system ATP-binding protein
MISNDHALRINNLHVAYAGGVEVLKGASFSVGRGRMVSITGANGVGKTTLLCAISGMLRHYGGVIAGGTIEFKGKRIEGMSPFRIIREGIIHILEEPREFGSLTIEENLVLGASARFGRPSKEGIEMIYEYFPPLTPRKKNLASDCGIGELQMLAVGRALMAQPEIILLDEPYQRMAPVLAYELFDVIRKITQDKGITFIFIERTPGISCEIVDDVYSIIDGKIYSKVSDGR